MKTDFHKYKKTLIFVMWLVFVIIKLNITAVADEIIPPSEFEDESFYKKLIEFYDTNGDGLLGQSEADAVEEIDISVMCPSAYSIKGIEHFTKLEVLWGIGSHVESLEPIRTLKSLRYLSISETYEITDYSPVYNLTSLKQLVCTDSNINDQDLRMFAKLNLYDFEIDLCQKITDFTPIANMTYLTTLSLGNSNFKDITILENFKQLDSLSISKTEITDFSLLSNFKSITRLNLDTKVKNLDFLKEMEGLVDLTMDGCKDVEDYSVIGELTNLQLLDIANCDLDDVQWLSDLTNLFWLSMGFNNIEVLPDMTDWTELNYIWLGMNKITKEEAMAKLPSHLTSEEDWMSSTGLINQRTNEDETLENDTRIITSSSDTSISAQGTFESDVYLEAKRIEDTSDYDNIIKEIHNSLTDIIDTSIYDIWLYKKEIYEGEDVRIKVQPNGNVKVMIEIEEVEGVRYHVFRQEDDNTLTKLNCYIEDRTLIFYSEHFSIFSVVISRLQDDEENTEESTEENTEGNPHKSDKGNYIEIQQHGIEENTAKTLDKINNEDNSSESSNINESDSTLWENGIEAADKPTNKRNNENDTINIEKSNSIESVVSIAVVGTVGAGLLGYDIMKRKRGDYMRNFQIDEPRSESANNK